jgi:2,4-dienoyl-CoA reductase-like NADH-dependent reductase (Old Yellow Enzyme family)/thioredoxin reductase
MMEEVACLFEPASIGGVPLRNRIVFPPVTTGYENAGMVTPLSRSFYRRIARGGAGLIILGDVSVQPSFGPTPYLYDDCFVPGLRELTAEVHAEGARVAAQIFHQEYDTAEIAAVMKTAGRAAAMEKLHEEMENYCNRLDRRGIEAVQERFCAAALRAREAGFDLLQIHGDRLVGMFASPLLNRRTDEYGGPLENRARFALEVVRKIRERVPDMPLEYKMAIVRTDPPMGKAGPTLEEAVVMARWLVEAGIAAFHVSLADHGSIGDTIPPMGTQPYGCFVDLAAAVKGAVPVPVTAVGRILYPEQAARIVASGQADLVALGRALIAEPDWPRKVRDGRSSELRLCIMCNHCADSLVTGRPIACAINAEVGQADDAAPRPAATPKRVLVAGGGPAGMEAARVAALRGHTVTLVEERPVLGGQLHICATPQFKQEVHRLREFLVGALERLKVDVRLNTGLTIELLDRMRPDAVIVATGARPAPLRLPGAGDARMLTAWEALADESRVGSRVVIVGGGAVGIETALFLARPDRRVTVVEMLDRIVGKESPTVMPFIERRLRECGILILTRHKVVDAAQGAVVVECDGARQTIECDTIVNAVGTLRHAVLVDEITGRGIECRLAGDCSESSSGTIADAVREGFRAGCSI